MCVVILIWQFFENRQILLVANKSRYVVAGLNLGSSLLIWEEECGSSIQGYESDLRLWTMVDG